MKIRGRVKWFFALIGVGLLLTLVLFGGYVFTEGNRQSFPLSGYILQVSDDNGEAQVAVRGFESGVKAREKFPASWEYRDTDGKKYAAGKMSFLHFEDGSISAFTDGTIVDMGETGTGVLEFYNIEPMMIMAKDSEGWMIDNNSRSIQFAELLWEISDEKLLAASDELELTLANGERKTINGYVELTWLDDGILQIANQDGIYRTIGSGTTLKFASGAAIDFGSKAVTDREGAASFTLNDLSADQTLSIDVKSQSTDWEGWTPPTFIIHNDDGSDGSSGDNGEEGSDGEQGSDGEKGKSGDSGKSGENGSAGGRANSIIAGEEKNLASDGMAKIMITDISGNARSMSFTLKVTDKDNILTGDTGVIEVRDAETGAVVWSRKVDFPSIDTQTFTVDDGSLSSDKEYIITAKSGYQQNMESGITNTGTKVFVTRSFYVSSAGISLGSADVTREGMTVKLLRADDSTAKSVKVRFKVDGTDDATYLESIAFDPKKKDSASLVFSAETVEQLLGAEHEDKRELNNKGYTVTLFIEDNSGRWTESGYRLTGHFLKTEPVIAGVEAEKFDDYYRLNLLLKDDPDSAYRSATFVITDRFGRLVKNISTESTGAKWYYDEGLSGDSYTIWANVEWNDNVNDLTVKTDSISVTIPDSTRLTTTYTDLTATATQSGGKDYIYGQLNLTANGDEQIVKDQVVTVTLAKVDGSWSTVTYIDLSREKWNAAGTGVDFKVFFKKDLEKNEKYILTVKGTLREVISLPNGKEETRDYTGILYQSKEAITAKEGL